MPRTLAEERIRTWHPSSATRAALRSPSFVLFASRVRAIPGISSYQRRERFVIEANFEAIYQTGISNAYGPISRHGRQFPTFHCHSAPVIFSASRTPAILPSKRRPERFNNNAMAYTVLLPPGRREFPRLIRPTRKTKLHRRQRREIDRSTKWRPEMTGIQTASAATRHSKVIH